MFRAFYIVQRIQRCDGENMKRSHLQCILLVMLPAISFVASSSGMTRIDPPSHQLIPQVDNASSNANVSITFPPLTSCVSNASYVCGIPGVVYPVRSVNITQLLGNATSVFSTPGIKAKTTGQGSIGTSLSSQDDKEYRFPKPFTISQPSNSWAGLSDGSPNVNVNVPDVQIGVGPSQVMEMVNVVGEVFGKTGHPIVNTKTNLAIFSLQSFYGTSDSLSDPTVVFDVLSGRWFTAIADESGPIVWFAVSNSADAANGVWYVYNFHAAGNLVCVVDQPAIGVSADKFVISGNNFAGPSCPNTYLGNQYWAVDKRQLIENTYSGTHFNTWGPNANQISVHPALSLSSTNTEYLVQAGNTPPSGGSNNAATLYSIAGVPPNAAMPSSPPQFTMSPFDPFQCPTQPGGTTVVCVPGADSRVQTVVWYQNKLWFALADVSKSDGNDDIRIAEINTATNSLLQNFDMYQTNSKGHLDSLFYPALTIDTMGNMIVIYGYSNVDDYPSLAVSEQAATDGYDTWQPPLKLSVGTQIANDNNRYGDYFAAAVDPSNPTNVWVAGETMQSSQCGGVNCWSTYIAELPQTSYFTSSVATSLTIQAASSGSGTAQTTSNNAYTDTISLSPQVTISLTSTDIDDGYCRSIGLVWDQSLSSNFWTTQPNSVISPFGGIGPANSNCTGGSSPWGWPAGGPQTQTFTQSGSHFLEFGISAFVGEWHAQISLNGIQMSDVDTDVNHHVHINFYVGGISLAAGPTGYTSPPSCTGNPAIITLNAGSTVSQNLNCSASPTTTLGTYSFAITTAGAWMYVPTTFNVVVTDFVIAANPSSITVFSGNSGSSSIAVTPLNGFTGTVSLSQTVSPSSGLSCSLTPTSISTSGYSSLSCSGTTVGSYTVTVTGTTGSNSHNTQVSVTFSSASSTVLGTDPSSSDWTSISGGSWQQVDGDLRGTGNYPELKSTATFQADRTVAATVITVTPGSNSWDVAWLRGKYVDDNNKIIMYLTNTKNLEIDMKKGGSWTYYPAVYTGQVPTAWHTFQMVFVGSEIQGYLDGTKYLDITDPNFATFGTSNIVLYSGLNIDSRWTSITVTTSGRALSSNPLASHWTNLAGTWTQTNGHSDGTAVSAELKSSSTFASDRIVQARAISINSGPDAWRAAWVRGKYIDDNNAITLILHTDGLLELQVRQNSVQRTLASPSTCNPTCLSPTAWHTFKMVFSGNTLSAYVDGVQYIFNLQDSSFSALGACNIALENGGNTESQFDGVLIN